jgi:hypothetical protein
MEYGGHYSSDSGKIFSDEKIKFTFALTNSNNGYLVSIFGSYFLSGLPQ